jgi:hypothetical protein
MCVATDIDQLEWRAGEPVAILELTRIDGSAPVPASYFEAIDQRKRVDRELQRTVLLAMRLKVWAYWVAYREDLSEFWVRRVWAGPPSEWRHKDREEYAEWLRSLGGQCE